STQIYTQEKIEYSLKNNFRHLVSKVRYHEYKVCKRIAKYVDYTSYINFELDFYSDLTTQLVGADKERQNGVLSIHEKRIHLLFRNNFPILESSISALIRFHFSDPSIDLTFNLEIWKIAAHWFSKVDKDIARKLLEKGLSVHPKSIQILKAHFDFVITNDDLDLEITIKVLTHCYTTLTENFEEIKVLMALLEIIKSYDFPKFGNFLLSRLLGRLINRYLSLQSAIDVSNFFFFAPEFSYVFVWDSLLYGCYDRLQSEESNIVLEKLVYFFFIELVFVFLTAEFTARPRVINWNLPWTTYSKYLSASYKYCIPDKIWEIFEKTFTKYPQAYIQSRHVNQLFMFISCGFDTVVLKLGHEYLETSIKDPDFWIKYIQIELQASQKAMLFDGHRVGNLYNRAIKELSGPLEQDFIQKYTIIKTKRLFN
ncbi:hypothetical protein MXB_3344, partial [Myxobolus squamalis]